jgi:hypothetical protein
MRNQEQAAIQAVARHFSAVWEKGAGSSAARLTVAGKPIAVETAMIKRTAGTAGVAKVRLRFDRVALGFMARLRAALADSVPEGKTVLVTITAPIRLDGKTAAELEEKIRSTLARRLTRLDLSETIYGNRIRVRLAKVAARRAPKVVGFVHNPDTDADILLEIAESLLGCIGSDADKRARFAGERWLVLVSSAAPSVVEAWRQVFSVLSVPTVFKSILIVSRAGQVQSLTG